MARWFCAEAERVYSMFNESEENAAARRLVEWIEARGGSTTARNIQRGHRQYKTATDAEAALGELVEAGLGQWETIPPTARGGRPAARFVLAGLDVVDTSTVDTTPLKPEKNGGSVSVDTVDVPKPNPGDWGEV